jgi:hypothetical protein
LKRGARDVVTVRIILYDDRKSEVFHTEIIGPLAVPCQR